MLRLICCVVNWPDGRELAALNKNKDNSKTAENKEMSAKENDIIRSKIFRIAQNWQPLFLTSCFEIKFNCSSTSPIYMFCVGLNNLSFQAVYFYTW